MADPAPDIGETFDYDGHGYRVTGWMKPATSSATSPPFGPDRVPLEFCTREDAVYVTGYGVCGVIRRVADVKVTGRVNWTEETIDAERRRHAAIVGQRLR